MTIHRQTKPGPIRVPKKLTLRPRRMQFVSIFAFVAASSIALLAASARRPAVIVPEIVAEEDIAFISTPIRMLARGELIKVSDFKSISWPRSRLSGSYITDIAKYEGHYALTPLAPEMPVADSALSKTLSETNAVSDAIPAGMRGITVKVDAESAVEGWARTGNFVDVILVRTTKEVGLEGVVIAENVKILSAGASAARVGSSETTARAPNTVTLLVSQEDALRIKTASNIGKLTFALRGNGDVNPTLTTAVDQKRLFGQSQIQSDPKPVDYVGRARGPDGKTYVLNRNSKWLRAAAEVSQVGAINSGVASGE